jgi:hypothetical protein
LMLVLRGKAGGLPGNGSTPIVRAS